MDSFLGNFPTTIQRRGHSITVVSSNPPEMFNEAAKAGVDLNYIRYKFYDLGLLGLFDSQPIARELGSLFRDVNPDVVHVNNLPFVASYQAVEASKGEGIPVVLHVHGVSAERGPLVDALQWVSLRVVKDALFRDADRFICLTASDAAELESLGCDPVKLRVVPNAVDHNRFTPGDSDQRQRCVFAGGRLVAEKGFIHLVEAMGELKGKDVALQLAGEGPLRGNLEEAIASRDLGGTVRLLGRVPHAEMADHYRECGAYALPSLKEGMPYSLLEAMSCEAPIVASDISSVRSLLDDGVEGLLVPVGDAGKLAAAITRLLDDRSYAAELGRRARERVIRDHDPEQWAERIISIYNEVKR